MNDAVDWMSLIRNERILEDGRTYGSVAENWQLAIDEALLSHDKAYVELPRGHDKTGRLACHGLCWLLEAPGRLGYAAGVDKDNARLFRNEMKAQARRNPRLFGGIEFYRNLIENSRNGSVLEILSSDAPSNIGLKFNLLLLNDFVDWQNREFFEVLISATGKVPGVKIWVESNAGRSKKGYKWDFREYARTARSWFFKTSKRWLASWTPLEWFSEQKILLTPATYRRLIDNEWIEGQDVFLTSDQVEAVTNPELQAAVTKPDDVELVATACDLGISKDAASVATLGLVKDARPARLLDLVVFPGSQTSPVQIADVENVIADHIRRFGSQAVVVDPWNMRKTIQDHSLEWPIFEYTFSSANLMRLTSDVFRRVVGKQIEIYSNAGSAIQRNESWDLQRELSTAIIRQMSYGERIDHKKSGYTDRIISIGMGLWWLGQNTLPSAQREFSVRII